MKLLCGVLKENKVTHPLHPGTYRTIINVHNPSNCKPAKLWWKVVAAGQRISSGPITQFYEQELSPDSGLEISCTEAVERILPLLPAGTFNLNNALFDGWLIIESEEPLDVVGAYSTGPLAGEVTSFHTDRAPARCIELCEDLDLILNTGTAAWETLDANGNWVPAVLTARPPGVPNTTWLNPVIPYAQGAECRFRLCFDLCAGASLPKPLALSLRADDKALVKVNGQVPSGAFHTTTWPWHTQNPNGNLQTATLAIPQNMLVAGRNCIEVTVGDTWQVLWGFCLAGRLTAKRGMCPGAQLPLLPCGSICYNAWAGHAFGIHFEHGCNGQTIPAMGPLRALQLDLVNAVPGATVRMKAKVGGAWSGWIAEGAWVQGPIQDLQLELQKAPLHCKLSYRLRNYNGWSPWTQSGPATNSTLPIEALEVRFA